MQPDPGNTANPESPSPGSTEATATVEPGLPPVKAPSGRFILQLFLVPGLIIAVAVGMFLFVRWMTGGQLSAEKFLKDLDSNNPEVRWRAAHDLSQALPRDNQLATDPVFGLELAVRLRSALDRNEEAERARKKKGEEAKPVDADETKAILAERAHIIYLVSSLGNFQVPVGAPLLAELADKAAGIDPETDFHRRAAALWALTLLGNNLRKFDQLPPERKTELMVTLKRQTEEPGDRGTWARSAFDFLDARIQNKPTTSLPIPEVLIRCAKEDAPFLRNQAAFALAFWDGDTVEDTLLALTSDDGRGSDPVKRNPEVEAYRKANPDEVRKANQKQISYTAVLNLARRGSAKLGEPQYDLLREMLDEEAQKQIWASEDPDRKNSAEANATQTVVYALQAIDELRRKNPRLALPLREKVEKLVRSENRAISVEAKELADKLKGIE